MKVSFIGLGIMGSRMAQRLATHGIDITVYNRNESKADELVKHGAKVARSLQECAANADVVFTMLSTPEVVQDVAFGKGGFIQAMQKESLWIDCSTVDPASARSFGTQAEQHAIRYVDAPVAGTKQPAENGELVFLVGGKEDDFVDLIPLFEIMGKKTSYLGEVGSGASMKMLINLMLAQSMAAFSEAVHLGKQMGLDEKLVYTVLCNSPVTAPFLQVLKSKIEVGNTMPNFPLKWMYKDLHLVTKVAYETGAVMPLSTQVKEIFGRAKQKGHGDDDFSTIYHFSTK